MHHDEAAVPGAGAPPGFLRRRVMLGRGTSYPSGDAEWRGAIVLVERGDVELECAAGGRRRFTAGAVLWLAGINLWALHNVGAEPVVLVAISRRRPAGPGGDELPVGPP